ncbi:MAG: epoxide hydrolase 1 [Acidimicrobiia bacterium]|nr:epoxide hydrolase 1 [Acidimicrobiia bacterium]
MQIEPFRIAVSDEVLEDLKDRLRRTRWPEAETVDDWSQGIPLTYVQEICDYWADGYDWRARERALNRFDQFIARPGDMDVHFIHARSPEADAVPLLITHGWPGSVVEFQKAIGPLTDPVAYGGSASDAFHVVCPSLPGFGFSGKPSRAGWGVDRIADCWAELMAGLGYSSYGAQGGDWGAGVSIAIGTRHPERCLGIHLNMVMRTHMAIPNLYSEDPTWTGEERDAVARLRYFVQWGTAYNRQHSTRPQTLGYGLTDSPAGQAAWILEKFREWTDCDGHPENALDRDELLDNVMLYWLNANATSSARLYWETFRPIAGRSAAKPAPVTVPTGVAKFPKEIVPPVRSWCEPFFDDLRHWTEMPRGGHFAAFEQPGLFVEDLRAFFRGLR